MTVEWGCVPRKTSQNPAKPRKTSQNLTAITTLTALKLDFAGAVAVNATNES